MISGLRNYNKLSLIKVFEEQLILITPCLYMIGLGIIYANSLIAEELQAQKVKLDEHILQLDKDHLDQINALKVEHEKQISWEKEKHEESLSNYRQLCKRQIKHVNPCHS